jgi:hypothetical protein
MVAGGIGGANESIMFDIQSADELFAMLRERFEQYRADKEKGTEDAFFMILGSNHLREWIAPGYKCSGKGKDRRWPAAKDEAQHFSRQMYENENFTIVRKLANGIKHLRASTTTTLDLDGTEGVAVIGHIGGKKILKAIPASHYVDGKDLAEVLEPVMELYATWFERL